MRGWKRKWLALALALCLLLPGGTALAQGEDEAAGPYIPFGEDVRGYDPAKDGYYALLPMQYETGTTEQGLRTLEKAYVPALVYEAHLYLSEDEIRSVLGLSLDKSGNTMRISAFERNLYLTVGRREGQFFAGDFLDTYVDVEMQLTAAPLEMGGKFYVPLRDLCILFDLGLHEEQIEGERFLTVYDPSEGVIDVLAYLYNNSASCKAAYVDANLPLLAADSALAQLAAKLLDGDPTAWAALLQASFGFSDAAYERLVRQLADELTMELLCVLPDEAHFLQQETVSEFSDVLNVLAVEADIGGNAAVDLDLMDAVFEARVASDPLVAANDPRWFSEALDKIDALTEQKEAIGRLSGGLDGAVTGVSTVLGMLGTAATYASVDELSSYGVGAIVGNKEFLTYSDAVVLDEIAAHAAWVHSSNAVEYSLYDYVSKNWGSWVLDGLSASVPAFKVLQLSSHLVPGIAQGVDATHSFQMSMLAIPLQSDVERLLLATMEYYPARRADEEGFKALTDAAYIYLKTCYLARNHAAGAFALSAAEQEAQQQQMDALLEKMAILSVNYGRTPENAYDKHYRLAEIADDADLIEAYAKLGYVRISGEVRARADDSPVEDAVCEVRNGAGEVCATFSGTPGGAYADLVLPLCGPGTCLPYEADLTLSAVLTFTSERVEGTGSISLRCPPGAVLDPAQTAYIGEEAGVAIASPLGVVSGELCAVTTRNIPEGAGIRELDLPVDAENGYYAASFAAYGGRIYFVEKQPGTSGDVPLRLCSCKLDGSDRAVLGDVSWDGMYFVIEDGVLTWQTVNYADWSTLYRSCDLESGEWSELAEPAGPLTRLIFRGYDLQGYDGNKTALEPAGEGAWTLYRAMRFDGGPGSLSISNVTVSESGETSVELVGEPGGIEGLMSLFAIHDGYAYVSAYEGNDGILYRLNLRDTNDLQEIARHPTAGGGDPFFNH